VAGLSIRATLLVSLSGGMIRDDYSVQSNSQDMTVNFTSDVSITYEGFQACVCVQCEYNVAEVRLFRSIVIIVSLYRLQYLVN